MMDTEMPIRVDGFAKLRQRYDYVGKTKFLCEFLRDYVDVALREKASG